MYHTRNSNEDLDKLPMALSDWRKAIISPTTYRVGSSTVRVQAKFVYAVGFLGAFALILLYFFGPQTGEYRMMNSISDGLDHEHGNMFSWGAGRHYNYNYTYPLTPAIKTGNSLTFSIVVIADLDKNSKSKVEENVWLSYLKRGMLSYNPKGEIVTIKWLPETETLKSIVSCGGRGMELSELVVFNGKLYTVDDRTGIIYEIEGNNVIPWVILSDGNGHQNKGFKSEWATVRNEMLYVGGLGKEWTDGQGKVLNLNPQWIKVVSPTGEISHIDWHNNFEKIKHSAGITEPGYMIHEAVMWSDVHKRWFFLPRRASKSKYDEVEDETRGTNLLITADSDFSDIQVKTVGDVKPTHGFSSFKFVPGSDDRVIVALKTEENKETIRTFVLAFNIDGEILFPETEIGNFKFEGIEFS